MDDILETNVNKDFTNDFNSDSHSDTNPEHFENQVDDSPQAAALRPPPPAEYSGQMLVLNQPQNQSNQKSRFTGNCLLSKNILRIWFLTKFFKENLTF